MKTVSCQSFSISWRNLQTATLSEKVCKRVRAIICFQGSRGRLGKFTVKKLRDFKVQSVSLFSTSARVPHFYLFPVLFFGLYRSLRWLIHGVILSVTARTGEISWKSLNCERKNCYRFKCRRFACAPNLHSFTSFSFIKQKKKETQIEIKNSIFPFYF